MWTGDNNSLFRDVPESYNQLMSLGLAGIVFGGADIPGFNGTPSDEMYIQFYQVGVYYPFFRAHCNMADPPGNMGVEGAAREPWLQSDRVQNVIRESVYHRYDLIMYIYTLFWEASTTGESLVRPLWKVFPKDVPSFSIEEQFMFGDKLMVSPKRGDPSEPVIQKTIEQSINMIESAQVQEVSSDVGGQLVETYLPADSLWFNYYSK